MKKTTEIVNHCTGGPPGATDHRCGFRTATFVTHEKPSKIGEFCWNYPFIFGAICGVFMAAVICLMVYFAAR